MTILPGMNSHRSQRPRTLIEVNMPSGRRRMRAWPSSKPLVVAVFSFRYDAHLVPDLLANIAPLTDGWISWDDRQATAAFSDEPARRRALIEAAHATGAKWILAVDPDERFEAGTASNLAAMVRVPGRIAWAFALRELYAASLYRVDGVWGHKEQNRLFPIFDDQFPILERQSFPAGLLHESWVPHSYRSIHSGLNLYHLKTIAPRRRQARTALYKALDPERKYQPIGYDYLSDDGGMALELIAPGRHYLPQHREDGGLWMADPQDIHPAR